MERSAGRQRSWEERTTPTEFDFQKGRLLVSCVNMDLGEAHEEVEVVYAGEGVKIGFNARYIMDFLSAVDSEQITIHLTDPLSPAIFRAAGMTGIVALLCRCGFDPEYDRTPVRKTVDGFVFVSSNKSQRSNNTGLPGF